MFYLKCADEQVMDVCLATAMGGGANNCRTYADASQLSPARPPCRRGNADRTDSVVDLLMIEVDLVYSPLTGFIGEDAFD